MDFMTQIVPAVIVMLANLAGGSHDSPKYEIWTAVFGWTFCFSLLTALTRGYEKLLKPLFNTKK